MRFFQNLPPRARRFFAFIPTSFTRLLALVTACFSVLACTTCRPPEPPASSAPLTQSAYVWQRSHTPAVADAIRAHAADFSQLLVLAAEVSWPTPTSAPADTPPRIIRVPLATDALRSASTPDRPLALVLRINAYRGSFAADAPATRALVELTRSLLADARASGLTVTEFQLDFDASEKRLANYRLWLDALRSVVAPARLTFTSLPSWLKNTRDFAALASAADGFVLQVHSLSRPTSPDAPSALCDPVAAREAIRAAARFNRPFRVALPTYGYRLAFNPSGQFFALSAEGPAPDWPAGTITRELSADPATLAPLVAELTRRHPAALTGILWYRLPVAGDRLNWTWPTLARVMRGEIPSARPVLEAHPSATDPALVEYTVTNTGDAAFDGPFSATVTWTGATRLASDTLPPFAASDPSPSTQRLATSALRLAPGARQPAGWLRLNQSPQSLHVSPSP